MYQGNNSLIKLPELESTVLNQWRNNYESIIDFNNISKLISFEGNSFNFLLLKNNMLEKVKILKITIIRILLMGIIVLGEYRKNGLEISLEM
jgi:hypothetical protein